MSHSTSNTTTLRSLEADPVLMRRAVAADAARIRALAQLDDKRIPAGPFLVADIAGEIVAAVSLSSGTVVADPFRLTGDSVAMLRLRATQVRTGDPNPHRIERHPARSGAPATAVAS